MTTKAAKSGPPNIQTRSHPEELTQAKISAPVIMKEMITAMIPIEIL
jgi:hypothetical protein